jgi:hypothetical protein
MSSAIPITPVAALTIDQIAEQVAHALIKISTHNETARLSLPLLYPGGSTVAVEISKLRDSFLVTDAGVARREAGLLGGERTFLRIAKDVAERFGVKFDQNMIFELEVLHNDLVVVVSAIANAAKTAVEETAMHLAVVQHADYRASLWSRLEVIHGKTKVERSIQIRGSSDSWEFDAAVKRGQHVSVFEIVVPNANAVNSAVTKFLDISDLGKQAPGRVAVLTNKDATPHLPVLARTAKWLSIDASDDAFRKAA